ncbi:PREDICTED: uncharacterized protein LOC104737325 [Camelina sativa]|uniref:Uncharacterized protein LOC104737325 n=1 Tax=Camelina sativa TaxID=90675 RepID=A0ABM0VGF4_CAMSA|nr:PREDICTED: uncharacterized protein LOC104737325 [Camelina sativa]
MFMYFRVIIAYSIFLNTSTEQELKKDQSMALMVKNRPYEYTKMENEDPQELIHRRAQFLIQKVLERADNKTRQQQQRRRSSGPLIMIRVVGIRMRIGKKLRKLRKNNSCVCNNLISRFLKSFKRFLCSSSSSSSSSRTISDLPPLFSIQV